MALGADGLAHQPCLLGEAGRGEGVEDLLRATMVTDEGHVVPTIDEALQLAT